MITGQPPYEENHQGSPAEDILSMGPSRLQRFRGSIKGLLK